MKRRAVVDTSTLIGAAIRPDSTPRRALQLVLALFEICLSDVGLAELELVLARSHLSKYASSETLMAFIVSIRAEARVYVLSPADLSSIAPRCRDAKDDHILALAQVAHADYIIASDQNLLTMHPWCRIPVLTPAQFLNQSEKDFYG